MIEETTLLHSTTLYWTNYVTTPFLTANLQKLPLYFASKFKEDHLSALAA